MISSAYASYLLSDHWTNLKRRLFAARGHRCEVCRSTDCVDAHHLVYRTPLTDGQIEDLMPLCRRCHDLVAEEAVRIRSIASDVWELRRLTWLFLSRALGFKFRLRIFNQTADDFRRQFGLPGARPACVALNRSVLHPPAGRRRWVQYVPGTPKSPWD